MIQKTYQKNSVRLQYYEIENTKKPLVLLHAQGVDSSSFFDVMKKLAKKFHVFAVDCYGHGGSLRDPSKYNVKDIGCAIAKFIEDVIGQKVWLLGHSSGGLIAAYIAAETDLCEKLILEDAPFFSSQGERRYTTFNYIDLATICHEFLQQSEEKDFVLYYFRNQYAWKFFPEKTREETKANVMKNAAKYRQKHPEKNLKVPFWPKAAMAAFCGMNAYDPMFGEKFYTDRFHAGIPHEDLLKKIRCETVFLKAETKIDEDGILMCALSDEDVSRVADIVPQCRIVRFDCGHGIHGEKERDFLRAVFDGV